MYYIFIMHKNIALIIFLSNIDKLLQVEIIIMHNWYKIELNKYNIAITLYDNLEKIVM